MTEKMDRDVHEKIKWENRKRESWVKNWKSINRKWGEETEWKNERKCIVSNGKRKQIDNGYKTIVKK